MGPSQLHGVSLVILKENITLLYMLNQEPERPANNPVPEQLRQLELLSPRCRVLDIKHEQGIAENLAFLAACSDNPLKVIALCIEEHPSGTGLIKSSRQE